MSDDQPQQFPQYRPPNPGMPRMAHPQQAKILLKVFKAFRKRGHGNSLTIHKRKKSRVV